jgi:hypothetical protein
MGILYILTGTGALALISVGLAMARFDEFRAAYWLFWVSGIVATIGGVSWELTTLEPALIRVGSGLVAGVAVFVFLPMLFRWLNERRLKAGKPPADIS